MHPKLAGGECHQRLDIYQTITNFWSNEKKYIVLEILESDSVECTNAVANENKQSDMHVNEVIEYINDNLNVTENKENYTNNGQIFENSRKLVLQKEERDIAQQEQ